MPALRATQFYGEVMFLGLVRRGKGPVSAPVTQLQLTFDGVRGDARAGRTRPSDARMSDQHPPDTEIANSRPISILSAEELAETAFAMRVPRLLPEWLGASIMLRGLPDLTHLPPSSRLQAPDGATLVIDMASRPEAEPAALIEEVYPGAGARYRPAAHNRAGITARVERPGLIELGQSLRLHVPDQRGWERMADVRG